MQNRVSKFGPHMFLVYCPRRVLAQTVKTRGGTLEVPAYRQDYFTMVEKISIFMNTACKGLPNLCWGWINIWRSSKFSSNWRRYWYRTDPEDGFWDKNNSEGIVSNSEVLVNLDIRGECPFVCVQLLLKYFRLPVLDCSFVSSKLAWHRAHVKAGWLGRNKKVKQI